ncbi:FAS1-like dehydratase domain-containing protein [Nocardia donostiensis]|uniref:FAS1-like dehydratase domain-containing protein n=1 Tax=Nocardia donostiensis TaxID=1538463 RepID=A0A1W0B1I4_9NOCA|nr:MaoC family dehydratase N-terminal domain-containing protein [Nocardia donostiensis]ONM46802.1 hypothetical protein B0T46_21390 [Nocardia donostiensis]OQS16276.1 hypothetical protein B0T36_05790 [Nocardia donostiensis]
MSDIDVRPAEQVRSLLDHRYRPARRFRVTSAHIRDFARIVQDSHPAYHDGDAADALGFPALIAPPTFASTILLRVHREILDTLITGYHPSRILHADQVLDIGRPIMAGDDIGCDIYFESFRHFADYDVMAIKSVLTDQCGQVLQTGSTALLARTGGDIRFAETAPRASAATRTAAAGSVVAGAGDHIVAVASGRRPRTTVDIGSLSVGAELPRRVLCLSRADLAAYARITGDTGHGPTEPRAGLGDSVADLPTAVAPGMLTLGVAAGYVTSWLGDPAAVGRLRAQFAHYTHYMRVCAGESSPIEFSGRITSLDPGRRRGTVAVEARSHGRRLFGYAAAEVRFAD